MAARGFEQVGTRKVIFPYTIHIVSRRARVNIDH